MLLHLCTNFTYNGIILHPETANYTWSSSVGWLEDLHFFSFECFWDFCSKTVWNIEAPSSTLAIPLCQISHRPSFVCVCTSMFRSLSLSLAKKLTLAAHRALKHPLSWTWLLITVWQSLTRSPNIVWHSFQGDRHKVIHKQDLAKIDSSTLTAQQWLGSPVSSRPSRSKSLNSHACTIKSDSLMTRWNEKL